MGRAIQVRLNRGTRPRLAVRLARSFRGPLRHALWRALLSVGLVSLGGCFFVGTRDPAYPSEWSASDSSRIGVCPDLSGTYQNSGEKYLESGLPCDTTGKGRRVRGAWDCSVQLADNLGVARWAARLMLSQPNADELVATPLDGSGGRGESRTLLRGRDFQCEAGSLSSSDTSSLLDGPALTAVGVLLLSGGYTQLSRSFSRNSDGELVMKVHENSAMFHVFVGGAVSGTAYVRWRPAGPAPMPGEVEK